jgi:hypothetical protein
MRRHYLLTALFLAALVSNGAAATMIPAAAGPTFSATMSEKFIRTELYFGRNKPKGGTVSEDDWQAFVDEFVTPRFPDGLTILDADGQWRGKDGSIAHEQSKVIVLLYPRKLRRTMNPKIEEIRAEYKRRFTQEAVMRIDITKSVEVSF